MASDMIRDGFVPRTAAHMIPWLIEYFIKRVDTSTDSEVQELAGAEVKPVPGGFEIVLMDEEGAPSGEVYLVQITQPDRSSS